MKTVGTSANIFVTLPRWQQTPSKSSRSTTYENRSVMLALTLET